MWPPLRVKSGLEVAPFSACAIRAPALASSVMTSSPGHMTSVVSGADAPVDRYHDDAATAVDLAPDLVNRPLGGGLRLAARQPVDNRLGNHGSHERLAVTGAAGGAARVIGIEPGTDDRAVADPAGVLAISAARSDGRRDPAFGVSRYSADRIARSSCPYPLLALGDEELRIAGL